MTIETRIELTKEQLGKLLQVAYGLSGQRVSELICYGFYEGGEGKLYATLTDEPLPVEKPEFAPPPSYRGEAAVVPPPSSDITEGSTRTDNFDDDIAF